ncbi:MAG: hypothetical protein ABIO70_18740 [Pseudomonadota bacterium]
MGRDRVTTLSTRSDTAELAALTDDPQWVTVLDADAQAACWRIVEAFSREGQPFELEVAWSSGGGAGAKAKVTVSRSTRLSVFARALQVRAANASGSENRVGVTVADGFAATRNQWEHRGRTSANGVVEVGIPPFADHLVLETADPDQLSGLGLLVYDGTSTLRAKVPGDAQPANGVPLGGAAKLEVSAAAEADFRVVFHLNL